MAYDYIDGHHPDVRFLLVTEPNGVPVLSIAALSVSKCEIYGLDGSIRHMEFNLVDNRNGQILAKVRIYKEKCECGSYSAHGSPKGSPAHADYCGWQEKTY